MATNLDRFSKFLKALDDEGLTKTDFVQAFERVIQILTQKISEVRQENAQSVAQMKDISANELKKTQAKIDKMNADMSRAIQDALKNALQEQGISLNMVRDKLRDFRQFTEDERDDLLDEMRAMIDALPTIPEFEMPEEIPATLKELQEGHERQQREIDELKKRPLGRAGGGITDIGVQASLGRSMVTETPTGAINSSNTDYTLSRVPNAVLSFHINGQAIPSADYSISGKTITFTSALDTALSGTEFEIVYV